MQARRRELVATAGRALERTRDARAAGAAAVDAKLDGIARLSAEITSLRLLYQP